MKWRHLVVSLVAVLPALVGAGVVRAPAATSAEPVRIMLVGDSVTHGAEGDWTWRYRLWKHFQAARVPVDFVGPYDGLYQLGNIFAPPTYSYVDPDFDHDHAARQGTKFEVRDVPIQNLVDDFHPDVVVVMLGVNDVAFGGATGAQVDQRMRDFVAEARAADPDLDLVVARDPQHWFQGVADYNALVPGTVAELTTDRSRLAVAYADVGFQLQDHTWDTAHANARGELVIAAAVADALSGLGVGPTSTRPLPEVPLGPRFAPTLDVVAGDQGALLTWTPAAGALSELVSRRDLTMGEPWPDAAVEVEGLELQVGDLVNGHTYQFRLRPKRGFWAAVDDRLSNVVSVTPRPATPGPPVVDGVSPFGTTALHWPAAPRASTYQVLARPLTRGPWRVAATTSRTRARVTGLVGRTSYRLAVRAVRDGVASLRSESVAVRIPAPRAVRSVEARRGPGRAVRVAGLPVPEASTYRLYVRTASSCRGAAPGPAMRAVRVGLGSPAASLRVTAPAAWVRLRAVRAGVVGELAGSSTTCLRTR